MRKRTHFLIHPLLLMGVFLVFASSCKKDDDNNNNKGFTDPRDGKVYKTVTIGTQVWMAENLAFAPSSGNYWAYDNDSSNVASYGYLYDWETALNVSPAGWHLPSDDEWTALTTYLMGDSVAGGKMKEVGTAHWISPNAGATNSSGFTALPGGSRATNGSFYNMGEIGLFWSSSGYNASSAWIRIMGSNDAGVYRDFVNKSPGLSVRCLKDN